MTRETHGFCPNCNEQCAINAEHRCLWCDAPTREKKRGGGKPAGVHGKLSDRHLQALHHFHLEQGVSIRELGRRIWEKAGYASPTSAAESISQGFKRLHLPALSRQAATVKANERRRQPGSPGTANQSAYKRYLRKKNGGYRHCQAVKTQAPGKGKPCSHYAMAGSEFCFVHDPDRHDQVAEQLAGMRDRIGAAV